MEERYRPAAKLFEKVILSWCREADLAVVPAEEEDNAADTNSSAAQRAQRLLERMEQLFVATANENEMMRPSVALYNAVCRALIYTGTSGEEAAAAIRQRRDRQYPPIDTTLRPVHFSSNEEVFGLLKSLQGAPSDRTYLSGSVRNFNFLLSLLARSGEVWAGQRAEDVLNYMLELSIKRENERMRPDLVSFNTVLSAWAKSGHREAGTKAVAVLEKLSSLHNMGYLIDVQADRVSYNTLMAAYAKSDAPGSALAADYLFQKLEKLYEEKQDENLKPDIVSYATLLNAYARSGEPGGARHAEEIVLNMQKQHRTDNTMVKPNTECFNEVVYAHARCSEKGAAKRAEMILNLMEDMHKSSGSEDVQPNIRSFNMVLYALSNSSEEDAPNRARELLKRMKTGPLQVKPDLISYSTIISAYTNQGGVRSLNQAELLVEEALKRGLEPDSAFVSSVITSLTRSNAKGAPLVAERILDKVTSQEVSLKLNTVIYNALINCWAKSGERGAAARAEEILHLMEDKYAQGDRSVKPNVQTYTSTIDAYAKSREPDTATRAEAILNSMEDRVPPNVHTYVAVIQNYARSDQPSKAARAQAILQRMKDDFARGNRDAKPTVVAYNAVLNACEFSLGGDTEIEQVEQAFKVACETLDELRNSEGLSADHVTYATFMGAISKLLPKSAIRFEMVDVWFRRCCADGQLGPVVLKKLKDAASPLQYSRLLNGVQESELPAQWTRNLKKRRRR